MRLYGSEESETIADEAEETTEEGTEEQAEETIADEAEETTEEGTEEQAEELGEAISRESQENIFRYLAYFLVIIFVILVFYLLLIRKRKY